MNRDNISQSTLETLGRLKVVISGSHIVYPSDRHGSVYVDRHALYPHPKATDLFCRKLAHLFVDKNVDTVIASPIGGIVIAQWIAWHLGHIDERDIPAVYAEEAGDLFVIKHEYGRLVRGARVLVVDDILIDGDALRKVIAAVREIGGEVVGIGAICNCGDVTSSKIGTVAELITLASVSLESWSATACPLCTQNVPINTTVGKGAEFLVAKKP